MGDKYMLTTTNNVVVFNNTLVIAYSLPSYSDSVIPLSVSVADLDSRRAHIISSANMISVFSSLSSYVVPRVNHLGVIWMNLSIISYVSRSRFFRVR